MDINTFIKTHNICVIFFTNHTFSSLNTKIKGLSLELGTSKFRIVDSTKELELINQYDIKSVPLFHIYKNGKLIEELFGNYSNICTIIRLHF